MIVWDAGALIALLRFEPGASAARRLVRAHHGQNFIHAVNLYEIYYGFSRAAGGPTAERALSVLDGIGIQARDDLDVAFLKDAAHLKVTHKMSVSDSFGLALARRLNAPFASTDHHELDAVDAAGLCSILFIR